MANSAAARPRSWHNDGSLTDLDRRMLAHVEGLYGPVAKPAPREERPAREAAARARHRTLGLAFRTLLLSALAVLVVSASPYAARVRDWADSVPFLSAMTSEDAALDSLRPKCVESRAELVAAATVVAASSGRPRRELLVAVNRRLSSETRESWPAVCRAFLGSPNP
jgi:hypothetical protein